MKDLIKPIPKRSIYSLIVFLGILAFTIFNVKYYIVPGFIEIFSSKPEPITLDFFGRTMWVPIISTLLIYLNLFFFLKIFKELKPYKEEGLIYSLFWSTIWGPLVSSAFGLLMGAGIIAMQKISPESNHLTNVEFIRIFVAMATSSLIIGLGLGAFIGIFYGLLKEFSEPINN